MSVDWLPNWVRPSPRGISRGLVDALATDIANGRLQEGAPLPSQRALAKRLGINFTTVTRAYDDARQRGLVEARAGQGTFVTSEPTAKGRPGSPPQMTDLSANSPPITSSVQQIGERVADLARTRAVADLMRRAGVVAERDAQAAAGWLNAQRFGSATVEPDRIAVSGGVRAALSVLLTTIVGPEGVLLTEALTWPAVRALANVLGVQLVGVALDDEGIIPTALEEACERYQPKALYCTPSAQNPTTATMSVTRRQRIAEIAAKHTVTIIEDDVYGFLGGAGSPPPIAALHPEGAIYLGGLAKSMMSGMRVAYVVHGTARSSHLFAARLAVSGGVAPPLELALATDLIEGGLAQQLLNDIRSEVALRREEAISILGSQILQTSDEALHTWLTLPAGWSRAQFISRLQHENISVIPSDAFALLPNDAKDCIRISLGGTIDLDGLSLAFHKISSILEFDPEIDESFM